MVGSLLESMVRGARWLVSLLTFSSYCPDKLYANVKQSDIYHFNTAGGSFLI